MSKKRFNNDERVVHIATGITGVYYDKEENGNKVKFGIGETCLLGIFNRKKDFFESLEIYNDGDIEAITQGCTDSKIMYVVLETIPMSSAISSAAMIKLARGTKRHIYRYDVIDKKAGRYAYIPVNDETVDPVFQQIMDNLSKFKDFTYLAENTSVISYPNTIVTGMPDGTLEIENFGVFPNDEFDNELEAYTIEDKDIIPMPILGKEIGRMEIFTDKSQKEEIKEFLKNDNTELYVDNKKIENEEDVDKMPDEYVGMVTESIKAIDNPTYHIDDFFKITI